MKKLILIAMFAASVLAGALFSTLVTMAAWNIQIEPRAFQCTDSMWPMSTYWEAMETHRSAGDTVSPGWTWEDLKLARTFYIIAFYLLWLASTALEYWVIIRMFRNRLFGCSMDNPTRV